MNHLQFDKINQESVVNNVVNQITALIVEGKLKSGDKIPTEIELSESFGVGRNSIREAIKILNAIGLLEIQRGKGTFITSSISPSFFDPIIFSLILEPKSNKDLYEFRMMFDSMVLINVIDKVTDEDLLQLKALVNKTREEYEKLGDSKDIHYFIQQDILFHKKLIHITMNPIVERIGYSILEFIPEYIKKSICQENGILRSITNHEKIIQTLEKKERTEIVNIIETTLVEWKNDWQKEED